MELKNKTVNFIGDSITAGVGASCTENRYTDVFARLFGAKVNNYGISATRIARQSVVTEGLRDRDFCMRFTEMDETADAVVVFGGTNDFGHGDAPLGTMQDRTPATFYGACHHIMTRLHERFPGKPILILTPLHRCNEDNVRGDGWKAEEAADLKTYVNIIREVAEYYSLPVLDLFAESGIQPKVDIIREKFCPDGLHPNDAGHVLLAKKIYAKLLDM